MLRWLSGMQAVLQLSCMHMWVMLAGLLCRLFVSVYVLFCSRRDFAHSLFWNYIKSVSMRQLCHSKATMDVSRTQ